MCNVQNTGVLLRNKEQESFLEAGEMAQKVRTLAALAEGLALVPSTHRAASLCL